jgi:hypothetical protein
MRWITNDQRILIPTKNSSPEYSGFIPWYAGWTQVTLATENVAARDQSSLLKLDL